MLNGFAHQLLYIKVVYIKELSKIFIYDLKALISMNDLKKDISTSKLYILINNIGIKQEILRFAGFFLDGGVDVIQLREKRLPDKDFISIAEDLHRLIVDTNSIFIINDRVEIARDIGVDGVHIGQEDLPINKVREMLGNESIIGVSTHNIRQAVDAEFSGADYIGVGPAYRTATKDYEPVAGLDVVREVVTTIKIPVFAIGGIKLTDIEELRSVGVKRIAVSGAIAKSKNVLEIVKEFKKRL